MKELSIDEIVLYVRREILKRDLDFVARALNPWNALGISAEITSGNYQQRNETMSRGIIILEPHLLSGLHVSRDNFEIPDDFEVEFILLDKVRPTNSVEKAMFGLSTLNSFLLSCWFHNSQAESIDIITPAIPKLDAGPDKYRPLARIFANRSILQEYNPNYVHIDPGISQIHEVSPIGTNPTDKPDSYQTTPNAKLPFRNIYDALENKLSSLYFRKSGAQNHQLFKLVEDKIELKNNVRDLYLSVLSEPERNTHNAMLLTQPFAELGIFSEDQKNTLYSDIIDELNERGYNIYLKPHPREQDHSYNDLFGDKAIIVENHQEAIEKQVSQFNPSAIIGLESTALIKCNALFDIPTYSYINEVQNWTDLDGWDVYAETYLSVAEEFVQPFENF